MREFKDEINWENFLDNYFYVFQPTTEKKEYKNGLTITYKKNNIYVWCDLSIDRLTIKKLEFGRLTIDEKGEELTNWIKGVFINKENSYTTFLQTSFDSEYFDKKNNYTFPFDNFNKNIIVHFLNTPCLSGWTEEEYILDQDKFYKVVVALDSLEWTIKIQNVAEQDMPFPTDTFDIWLRVKIADLFWNNKRRTLKKILVKPMKA